MPCWQGPWRKLLGASCSLRLKLALPMCSVAVGTIFTVHNSTVTHQQRVLCRFAVGEGDLITFLNIWKGWEDAGRSRTWCYKNFINHRTMLRAADIRNQLQRHLRYTVPHKLQRLGHFTSYHVANATQGCPEMRLHIMCSGICSVPV